MDGWDSLLVANDRTRELLVPKEVNPWIGSPFEWLMSLPSRSRGAAGEAIVANWLAISGCNVEKPMNSGHDRLINGHKVEIKLSTLWRGGNYVWQQLRDQDYEFVLLLGLSPHGASAWCVPKRIAHDESIPQHGGSTGTDTRWLTIRASNTPPWMQAWGGSLDECLVVVGRVLY